MRLTDLTNTTIIRVPNTKRIQASYTKYINTNNTVY